MDSCQALIPSAPSSGFDTRSAELEMTVMTDSDVEEPSTPLTPHPVTKDYDDSEFKPIFAKSQLNLLQIELWLCVQVVSVKTGLTLSAVLSSWVRILLFGYFFLQEWSPIGSKVQDEK